jgi:peptidoglycan hydrolase-like protein with peptidoglycan-binding domain
MRKFFALSAMALLLALHSDAQADDVVRSAQTILKSAGYYSGEATGELSADTKAALRRYQIRNQLEPTGELTPETVAALNREGAPESAPAPAAPVPPPVATPTPYSQPAPPPPAAVVRQEPAPDYRALYARTPYLNAPPEVQRETLRKAQAILAQRGFYDGPVNGFPSPQTEEALLRFQSSRELPRTGALDIDTLAELHLLPVSRRPIRLEERPSGAVRGVPVD